MALTEEQKVEAIRKAAEELVTKGKTGIVIDSPFWASVLLKLEVLPDDSGVITPTMATNGELIVYSPPFVKEIGLLKTKGVLAHEVGHVIFLHPYRRGERDPVIWNMAGDYAINPIIVDAGYELPDGCLIDNRFRNMETEAIYDILEKEQKKGGGKGKPGQGKGQPQPGQVPDPGGCGGVYDAPHKTKEELAEKERDKKEEIKGAMEVAKKMGKLPGAFERTLEGLLEPTVNWVSHLAAFVDTYSKNDFCWHQPNRRYISQGLYLPSLRSPALGQVVMLLDASGSVSANELRELVSEGMGILEAYQEAELHAIFFDTVADKPLEITSDYDVKKLKVHKGGGTDYIPPFKMIEESGLDPVVVVVLTDGECSSFPKKSPAPTLWVLNQKKKNFKPPFGEVITMPKKEKGEDY